MTPPSSAETSYGHSSRKLGRPAKARLSSDSCSWHSTSSVAPRPAQIGSPMPRIAPPCSVREVVPGGDDPRRVVAEHGHVRERDPLGVGAQGRSQRCDLRRADRHEHRLSGCDSFAEERQCPCQKSFESVV